MENRVEDLLKETLGSFNQPAQSYSPLALAYIGDGVYELFIRTFILNRGNKQVNKYHKEARALVNAKTQAKLYHVILPHLTPEEEGVLKRGRNAKSFTTPKHADVTDYRHATGLEALVGYLYLSGNLTRLKELMTLGIAVLSDECLN
jgi:ribonuclease-3 family protein